MQIGFEIKMKQPFEKYLSHVIEALKEKGFGVLTQIDVKYPLKEKIDDDIRRLSR